MTINITYNWNTAITSDDMQPKSIYLDGSCRGFHIRHDIGSVSFDHHTGCVRSITYATCVQVLHALLQGFDVNLFEQVVVDDIDADTVVSLWLLLNPHKATDKDVQAFVRQIGYVDAHFTNGFVMHPLHPEINPFRTIERTEQLMNECLDKVTRYLNDPEAYEFVPEKERQEFVSNGYGFKVVEGKLIAEHKENVTFSDMYEEYKLVLMYSPMQKGTRFTIGKYSEFVMLADIPTLLSKLARLELLDIYSNSAPTKNWGGSSTIGGSAMYADQNQGSVLSIDNVVGTILDNYND